MRYGLGYVEIFALRFLGRIKSDIKKNLGAPFVFGFMVLLMVAAVSLVMGLEFFANGVAVFAYFALVVGVVLQLVCFLKQDNNREVVSQNGAE